ncbi:methyltransferase, TIGR04325 family [Chelativorans sp. AA-79]|uniref:methyltransferase, TIGR04325 family n=1 Tax=Chelativorans sp. AA-79 TaxID=3028735 RepID=UPI0023FA19F6|nr:methyltransferase, TIGR04325 family [Chelativorans sp. AA-79]WEX10481.1 methyltransferase, TIGR04325 family [Chelativorans sp. AA-79]
MTLPDMLARPRPRPLPKLAKAGMRMSLVPLRVIRGRLRYLSPFPRRFSGAYPSHAEALRAASRRGVAGYDHDEVADVAFEKMCQVAPWDYPVLFWLRRLSGEVVSLVDAGGHMGTKYRAFFDLLPVSPDLRWTVYDVPAVVRAGRRRAEADGLQGLEFVERLEDADAADLFLGSGLLQYLDVPLPDLLRRMRRLPRHLLLNKVALRAGPGVVTLERIGTALVPYQIRNEADFLREVETLGYVLVDRWHIPSLSHVIETHPELGASRSEGFYFRLR